MQPLWLPPSSLNQPWESSIFFSLCLQKVQYSVMHHRKQDNVSLSTKSINPTSTQLSRGFVFAISRSCLRSSFRLTESVAVLSSQKNMSHITSALKPLQGCQQTLLCEILDFRGSWGYFPFLHVVGVPCVQLFFCSLGQGYEIQICRQRKPLTIFLWFLWQIL